MEIVITTDDTLTDGADVDEVIYLSVPTSESLLRDLLRSVHDLRAQGRSWINDAVVVCSDGCARIPASLLALISPVFKACACAVDDLFSVLLPDLTVAEFDAFLRCLCLPSRADRIKAAASDPEVLREISDEVEIVQKAWDLLCAPFHVPTDELGDSFLLLDTTEWGQQMPKEVESSRDSLQQAQEQPLSEPREGSGDRMDNNKENAIPASAQSPARKRRRRAKAEVEPYMKTEVMETTRQDTTYRLRKRIKRKRFTDEVSDPESIEEEEEGKSKDISSDDATSDVYAPSESGGDELRQEDESDEEDDHPTREEEEDVDLDESDWYLTPGGLRATRHGYITVRVAANGDVSMAEDGEQGEGVVGGRIVLVAERDDEKGVRLNGRAFKPPRTNPRSLLKSSKASLAPAAIATSVEPSVFFCSECESRHLDMHSLKRHAAREHRGSRFFALPGENPHSRCAACKDMMAAYERTVAETADLAVRDLVFHCPHCRRRFSGGDLAGLASHLSRDHRRSAVYEGELGGPWIFHSGDASSLRCDFCQRDMEDLNAVNSHLISCPRNNCGHSAGLFCWICGKVFALGRHLKDHLLRHGKERLEESHSFLCDSCPVACTSESSLAKHVAREHATKDPDEDFVLHENCQRCGVLQSSYLQNKNSSESERIPDHNLVFKCPHCRMALFAHPRHAPRYLFNHVAKFHSDPDINDYTVGDSETVKFSVMDRSDPACLDCDFCGRRCESRFDHNCHLSSCKSNDSPCRPGYMCNSCGFIGATSRHLRQHLESQDCQEAKALHSCRHCDYVGKSARLLQQHVRRRHQAKRKASAGPEMVACPKCGKEKRSGQSFRMHERRCGSGPARVKCGDCEMDFKRLEDMQAHALIHIGQVTCPIHNILFHNESEVFQHVNQAPPDAPHARLQCCMCASVFRHMCHLMKHLRRHLRLQPYRCGVCDKYFNCFSSLTNHQRNQHGVDPLSEERRKGGTERGGENDSSQEEVSKAQSFHCDQCSKCFSTKGHLKEHVLGVHQGTNQVGSLLLVRFKFWCYTVSRILFFSFSRCIAHCAKRPLTQGSA